jgi:VanZ family protein
MNSFVSILSVALYIFSIFFCADSPIVSQIGVLNPYSLLHVPLYGFLTYLLLRAFGWDKKPNYRFFYAITAFLAVGIAVLDEWNQCGMPNREASITDVFLDAIGVSLALFLTHCARSSLRPSLSNQPDRGSK